MPTQPLPQHIAHADTAADTAAVDTSQLYHAPLYSDSLPTLVAADSAAAPLNQTATLQPVSGQPASPRGHSLIHDTGAMSLLIAAVFFLVVSYRIGYKYIEQLAHNMFSVRRRESLFEDNTVNETQILSALILLSCTLQGLLAFQAISTYHPSLSLSLQQSTTAYVLIFAGIALAFYLLQIVFYNLLGFIFADRDSTRVWLDGFKASQATLGLLLFPVAAVSLAIPSTVKTMLIIAASLYICCRIVFISKGFRIFYSNLMSVVYLILYLCSVEIVPLVLIYVATIAICNHITF